MIGLVVPSTVTLVLTTVRVKESRNPSKHWIRGSAQWRYVANAKDLAVASEVTYQAISELFNALRMNRKRGAWVPLIWSREKKSVSFFTCEQLPQRQKCKGFPHQIITRVKNVFVTEVQRDNNNGGWPIRLPRGHLRDSWSGPRGSKSTQYLGCGGFPVYLMGPRQCNHFMLLKPNECTTREQGQTQMRRLSRALLKERSQYRQRQEKVFLQHESIWPLISKLIKTHSKTLKCEVLSIPYTPDIVPSDYHLFCSIALRLANEQFHSYGDNWKWFDSWITPKNEHLCHDGNRALQNMWKRRCQRFAKYWMNQLLPFSW